MKKQEVPPEDRLLTSTEVAALFRVNSKTLKRWCDRGRIPFIVTPGGSRRRFREADVKALLSFEDGAR